MRKDILFLFDWGGIIEPMEQWAGNWERICSLYNLQDRFEEVGNAFYAKNFLTETSRNKNTLHKHIIEWLGSFGVNIDLEGALLFEQRYLNEFRDDYTNENLLLKIEELKSDFSTGIFSNVGVFDVVRQEIQTKNYAMFDKVYLSCDIGVCKPDIKIYKEVEKEFNPKKIYYFDDSLANVITARNRDWNAFCPRNEKEILQTIEKILGKGEF